MATKKKTSSTKKPSTSAARPRSYSDLYKADKTRTVSVVTTPNRKLATSTAATASTESVNWREEYAYVVRDLRTLGIVSAALFGIIIIAGFFI